MTKKLIGILLLSYVVNIQCKKETHSENNFVAKIDVSQITETDLSGNIMAHVDNTDWTEDNTWTSEEYDLFQTPSSSQLTNSETAAVAIYPAFPNPLAQAFMFSYNTSKVTLIQIVLTDNTLSAKDRYFFNTKVGYNLLEFNLDDSKYLNNTNCRMYYGFYSSTGELYFKGHGDIKIKR